MAAGRPERGSHAPGTFFYDNNSDFNVAGAIYARCAGHCTEQAFRFDEAALNRMIRLVHGARLRSRL